MVGVLLRGTCDNGKGLARMQVLRHQHEVENGHTSSISHQTIAFDESGNIMSHQAYGGDSITPREIMEQSSKIIHCVDLAGNLRYNRTTILGLTCRPVEQMCACLCIDASDAFEAAVSPTGGRRRLKRMTLENASLVSSLKIRMVVILTKIDTVSIDQVDAVSDAVVSMLSSSLAAPAKGVMVSSPAEARSVQLSSSGVTSDQQSLVPIIKASFVTGKGLPNLVALLASLEHKDPPVLLPSTEITDRGKDNSRVTKPSPTSQEQQPYQSPRGESRSPCISPTDEITVKALPVPGTVRTKCVQFHIDDTLCVSGVGTVVLGFLLSGEITDGQEFNIGPDKRGRYHKVIVSTIHINRVPVRSVRAGYSASLAIKFLEPTPLLSPTSPHLCLGTQPPPRRPFFSVSPNRLPHHHYKKTTLLGWQTNLGWINLMTATARTLI